MIWQKYLTKQILWTLLFFTAIFFLLFALFDYSLNASKFVGNQKFTGVDLIIYYLCQWIKRAEILLPLALLLASMRVLGKLSSGRELVAMQAAGISKKRLSTPFVLVASLCTLLLAGSFEWVYPKAADHITHVENHILKKSKPGSLQKINLEDGSTLVYHNIERDLIWIKSPTEFWKINEIKNGKAHNPEHFKRSEKGKLTRVKSADFTMPNLDSKELSLPENMPLSKLLKSRSEEEKAHHFYKWTVSLFPILTILSILPFLMGYSRSQGQIRFFAIVLFAFIAYIMTTSSGIILALSGTLSPWIALVLPTATLFLYSIRKFVTTS